MGKRLARIARFEDGETTYKAGSTPTHETTTVSEGQRNELIRKGIVDYHKRFESMGGLTSAASSDSREYSRLAIRQYTLFLEENPQYDAQLLRGELIALAIKRGVKNPNKMLAILEGSMKEAEDTIVFNKRGESEPKSQ